MPRFLVYLIYNLLLPAVLLLGFPAFLIKGIKRGGLARNFRQRFGWFRERTLCRFQGERPIWVHAVSVGEVLLALKVIEALHSAAPGKKIVLSTTTTTAFGVADQHTHEFLTVIHNPVDLPFVTTRVIRLIRPEQFILIEAEIWPNLVGQLKRKGIPVKLINARLSPRSQRRYQKVRPLIKPVFSLVDQVTVPFETDIERWVSIGVAREKIQVLGSVKFDNTLAASDHLKIGELKQWLSDTGLPRNSKILLGGSTHDGEESLLAHTASVLKGDYPDLELVIIPRHAERGPDIANQLKISGFEPVLRKSGSAKQKPSNDRPKAWVANTTGELRAWYHLADIVVVGKSLYGEGGQNPVEPILTGKPTIVGPNMQNFSDVVTELVNAEGIVQITGFEELEPAIRDLLSSPQRTEALARNGAATMERHRGASTRTAALILNLGAFHS